MSVYFCNHIIKKIILKNKVIKFSRVYDPSLEFKWLSPLYLFKIILFFLQRPLYLFKIT
jgi:hypothetical protein